MILSSYTFEPRANITLLLSSCLWVHWCPRHLSLWSWGLCCVPRVMSEVVFGMRLSLYLFRGAYNFLSHRIYSWFMVLSFQHLSFLSFFFLFVGCWKLVKEFFFKVLEPRPRIVFSFIILLRAWSIRMTLSLTIHSPTISYLSKGCENVIRL